MRAPPCRPKPSTTNINMIKTNTPSDQVGCAQTLAGLDLPSSDFSASESFKKYTYQNIAPAILSGGTEYHQRLTHSLLDCSESVTVARSGRVIHHARCKRTICLLCAKIKAEKEQAIIDELPDHLPFTMADDPERDHALTPAIGIKLTLNSGRRVPGPQIRETIKKLHRLFGSEGLLKTKAIKANLIGYHRATEVTLSLEDGELSANPHIHALLWFDISNIDDRPHFIAEMCKLITFRWTRLIKRRFKVKASPSAQRVEPLDGHTNNDIRGWLTYTVKGIIPDIARSIPSGLGEVSGDIVSSAWLTLEEQLKGLHLHQSSRNVSSARKDATAVINLGRARRDDHIDVKDSKPTHRWSDGLQRWVPVAEWSPHHDRDQHLLITLMKCVNDGVRYRFLRQRIERHRQIILDDEKNTIKEYLTTGQIPKRSAPRRT